MVAVSLRNTFYHAVKTQAAEVIGHLTLRETVRWLPEQRCQGLAEMVVGKAGGQELEQ